MRKVTIDPITRLEGHGKIEIFLDEAGNVANAANAYLQVPELRGFEKFCQRRPVEEMPRITTRICGVCPSAHHVAFNIRPMRNGIMKKVNLIVATVQNNPAMNMSVKKAAQGLIKAGRTVTEGLLNMVEMAFRACDPCIACATHCLPGQMPLEVIIRDFQGNEIQRLSRGLSGRI